MARPFILRARIAQPDDKTHGEKEELKRLEAS
jgi:hypothetical protein